MISSSFVVQIQPRRGRPAWLEHADRHLRIRAAVGMKIPRYIKIQRSSEGAHLRMRRRRKTATSKSRFISGGDLRVKHHQRIIASGREENLPAFVHPALWERKAKLLPLQRAAEPLGKRRTRLERTASLPEGFRRGKRRQLLAFYCGALPAIPPAAHLSAAASSRAGRASGTGRPRRTHAGQNINLSNKSPAAYGKAVMRADTLYSGLKILLPSLLAHLLALARPCYGFAAE